MEDMLVCGAAERYMKVIHGLDSEKEKIGGLG